LNVVEAAGYEIRVSRSLKEQLDDERAVVTLRADAEKAASSPSAPQLSVKIGDHLCGIEVGYLLESAEERGRGSRPSRKCPNRYDDIGGSALRSMRSRTPSSSPISTPTITRSTSSTPQACSSTARRLRQTMIASRRQQLAEKISESAREDQGFFLNIKGRSS